MSNARNLARLLPNASGQLPDAAMSSGSVLQVVSVTKTDVFTTTSSAFVDVTGLAATIAPISSNSKILVTTAVSYGSTQDDVLLRLVRDSTVIDVGTSGSSSNGFAQTNGNAPVKYATGFAGTSYLDSPATTATVTYKVQIVAMSGTSTAKINNRGNDAAYGTTSSITLMEIAA